MKHVQITIADSQFKLFIWHDTWQHLLAGQLPFCTFSPTIRVLKADKEIIGVHCQLDHTIRPLNPAAEFWHLADAEKLEALDVARMARDWVELAELINPLAGCEVVELAESWLADARLHPVMSPHGVRPWFSRGEKIKHRLCVREALATISAAGYENPMLIDEAISKARDANDLYRQIVAGSVSIKHQTKGRSRRQNNQSRRSFHGTRRMVFIRDGGCCRYCGRPVGYEFHIDHILPRTLGGTDELENWATSCVGCNLRKGGKSISEAKMTLLPPPEAVRQ